jgi:hypothetical protein
LLFYIRMKYGIAITGVLVFIFGLYIVYTYSAKQITEGFSGEILEKVVVPEPVAPEPVAHVCPDLLVQKANKVYLYSTNEPEIQGVNPIMFDNLHQYTEYIEYKRSKGIRCPVLHLKQVYDTQGKSNYRFFAPPESPLTDRCLHNQFQNIERGLVNSGFNPGNRPSYDSTLQNLGVYTPLDAMEKSCDAISDSAMDTHWGGVQHSRNIVDSGKYDRYTRKGNHILTKPFQSQQVRRAATGRKKATAPSSQCPTATAKAKKKKFTRE